MSNNSEKSDDYWIDFKDIKAKTEVRPVLEYFGLLKYLELHGAELVGFCPIGKEHGKQDSFCFNVEKRSFQCFACKSHRGSVLDFVAQYQGVNLREAAKIVLDIFGESGTTETGHDNRQPEKGRPYGKKPSQPPNPETRQETKPPDTKKNAGKSFFLTWAHAEFLIQTHRLDTSRLAVLDTDALEAFMKTATKKDQEDSA